MAGKAAGSSAPGTAALQGIPVPQISPSAHLGISPQREPLHARRRCFRHPTPLSLDPLCHHRPLLQCSPASAQQCCCPSNPSTSPPSPTWCLRPPSGLGCRVSRDRERSSHLGSCLHLWVSSHLGGCTQLRLPSRPPPTAASITCRQGRGLGPCSTGSPRSPQAAARCRTPIATSFCRHLQCSSRCSPRPAPCPAAGSGRWGPLEMPWCSRRTGGTQHPPTRAPNPARLRSAAAAQRWKQVVSLGAAERAAGCPHRVAKLALPHWGWSCFSSSDNERSRRGGHR